MFLVCGEAVIDFFEVPGQPLAFNGQPAGSPFNVAIGLARLGAPATFLTGLSRDAFGERLITALAAEGVGCALAPRTNRPTILAFVLVKPDGGPEYAFYGENGADVDVPEGAIPWPLPPEIRAVHVGGFPMAVEPSKSSYARLIRQAGDQHFVSLDPNIRLSLIGDAATFREHFERLCASAALIKASTEDIGLIYPGDDAEAVGQRWRAFGAGTVVITDGPNGATALNQAGRAHVPTAAVTVIDTVGAGDSFMSALLAEIAAAALLDRDTLAATDTATLARLLTFANRAAGITCSRRGANPPTRAEIGPA